MIRSILVLFALILFFIVFTPIMIILLILRLFKPQLAAKIGQPIIGGIAFRFVMFFTGYKMIVKGRENIPKDQPVMFAANHRSLVDACVGYMTVPFGNITGFVAKKELKKVPFLNWWMMILNCEFIDRSTPKAGLESIKKAIENIKNGWSIFIMPAGTRSQGEEIGDFKGGSFKIAERTHCPIVPVAIAHTDDILENHFPKIKPATVSISYGKPIYTNELSRDEFRDIPDKVHDEVARLYSEIV